MSKSALRKLWAKESYYRKINIKEDFSHPGFVRTQDYCITAKSILDVGSGDGSKLERLGIKKTKRIGCDVSLTGLSMGAKKHPKTGFISCEGEQLPFKDDTFERVTCFFVLEHTHNPAKVLLEMVRVTQEKGLVCILTPNFGAPNRASPNYVGSRTGKLLRGFFKDFMFFSKKLLWQHVEPNINTSKEFEPDLDTTVEPYLLSLVRFMKRLPVRILAVDAYWEKEEPRPRRWQKLNRFLAQRGIFPFKYWGPHLFFVAERL